MLRYLLTPRWLSYLALAVLFAVVAVLLGNWQYSRHEAKVERRDTIEANYDAVPVTLTSVLDSPDQSLAATQDWTRVEITGRYRVEDQLLVRNRPYRSVFGYEVLVPFSVDGSSADLLVDRGWVPNGSSAATLPEVPPAPDGVVTLTGWLRPSEEDFERNLPAGQVATINTDVASSVAGVRLYSPYLELQDETGTTPAERPAPAEAPDTGLGVNFAYSLQWWIFSPIGLVLVLVMARRDVREAEDADLDAPGRTTPVKEKVGAKKSRIWDDEDY